MLAIKMARLASSNQNLDSLTILMSASSLYLMVLFGIFEIYISLSSCLVGTHFFFNRFPTGKF